MWDEVIRLARHYARKYSREDVDEVAGNALLRLFTEGITAGVTDRESLKRLVARGVRETLIATSRKRIIPNPVSITRSIERDTFQEIDLVDARASEPCQIFEQESFLRDVALARRRLRARQPDLAAVVDQRANSPAATYVSIAGELGISPHAARGRYVRGIARIRRSLCRLGWDQPPQRPPWA